MSLDLRLIVDEFNVNVVKPSSRSIYEFEEYRLDAEHLMLYRDEIEIPLTPKQVETLLALVEHGGEIVSKEVLMSRLWGTTTVEESNLIQHIHFLRKVLGETKDGRQMIETLRRRGYRFNGKIEDLGLAPAPPLEFTPKLVDAAAGRLTNGASEKGAGEVTRLSRKIVAALATLGFVCGLVVLGYFLFGFSGSAIGKKHFAVLPLRPIDASNRVDLYEFGVADALIIRLNSIDGFITRPLSETRKYTQIDLDPLTAGREQKADYVLAPNYQLAEGKIRITSQLWNVSTGQVEESYVFQKEASSIFAIQDAVASDIASRLEARFGGKLSGPPVRRGTDSEEAYRLYQLGMAYADKRGEKDFQHALDNLNRALTLDPYYANAWAGLARVVRPGYGKGSQTQEEHQRSINSINKALSIDPNLADAYVSLCDVKLFYEYDAEGAESACKRALELDPNSADAHLTYNMFLISRGRLEEALAEIRAAMDLAPASFLNRRQYANTLHVSKRYAEAEDQYKQLIDYADGNVSIYRRLIRTLEAEGKEAEALEYVIKIVPLEGGDDATIDRLREAYATSGWRGVTAERIKASEGFDRPMEYWRAQWYAYLGDKDKAFESLEECLKHRNLMMMFLRVESHHFDSLKEDPRFDDLISRVEGK